MRAHVLHVYQFNLGYAKAMLADIPEDRMTVQPSAKANHPAWIVGHLALVSDFMATQIGTPSAIPGDWGKLFGKGTTPTQDASVYPNKQTLIDALEDAHQRLAKAYAEVDEKRFADDLQVEGLKDRFPKVGDLLVFGLTSHEAIHLGQLSAWRRTQGFGNLI